MKNREKSYMVGGLFLAAIIFAIFFSGLRFQSLGEPYWNKWKKIDIRQDYIEFEWYAPGWGSNPCPGSKTCEATTEISGYDLSLDQCIETYPPEDERSKLYGYDWETTTNDCTFDMKLKMKCSDGEWRYFKIRGNCEVTLKPRKTYNGRTEGTFRYCFAGRAKLYIDLDNIYYKPCEPMPSRFTVGDAKLRDTTIIFRVHRKEVHEPIEQPPMDQPEEPELVEPIEQPSEPTEEPTQVPIEYYIIAGLGVALIGLIIYKKYF